MTIFQKVMKIRRAVVFRREKGFYGHAWTNSTLPISINLPLHARRQPSRTYFHECLHLVFPNLSERDIRAIEEAEWKTLTAHQQFLLARKLYNRKWRAK